MLLGGVIERSSALAAGVRTVPDCGLRVARQSDYWDVRAEKNGSREGEGRGYEEREEQSSHCTCEYNLYFLCLHNWTSENDYIITPLPE